MSVIAVSVAGSVYSGGYTIGCSALDRQVISMIQLEVTEKERKLIEYLRALPYGEVTVIMHNGEPDRVEKVKEKVKL